MLGQHPFCLNSTPSLHRLAVVLMCPLCTHAIMHQSQCYRIRLHNRWCCMTIMHALRGKQPCSTCLALVFAEVADEASTWMLIEGNAPPVQYSGGPRMIVMTSSPAKQYREFLKGRQVPHLHPTCEALHCNNRHLML